MIRDHPFTDIDDKIGYTDYLCIQIQNLQWRSELQIHGNLYLLISAANNKNRILKRHIFIFITNFINFYLFMDLF
jgi:hypothetical protein